VLPVTIFRTVTGTTLSTTGATAATETAACTEEAASDATSTTDAAIPVERWTTAVALSVRAVVAACTGVLCAGSRIFDAWGAADSNRFDDVAGVCSLAALAGLPFTATAPLLRAGPGAGREPGFDSGDEAAAELAAFGPDARRVAADDFDGESAGAEDPASAESDPLVSARATPWPVATAAPTPKATARPPAGLYTQMRALFPSMESPRHRQMTPQSDIERIRRETIMLASFTALASFLTEPSK
jgi:hypothetical protein